MNATKADESSITTSTSHHHPTIRSHKPTRRDHQHCDDNHTQNVEPKKAMTKAGPRNACRPHLVKTINELIIIIIDRRQITPSVIYTPPNGCSPWNTSVRSRLIDLFESETKINSQKDNMTRLHNFYRSITQDSLVDLVGAALEAQRWTAAEENIVMRMRSSRF